MTPIPLPPTVLRSLACAAALSGALLGMLAAPSCRALPAEVATPDARNFVSLEALAFSDPATESRFRGLYQCLEEHKADFNHASALRIGGNFISSRWCRGEDLDQDCRNVSLASDRPGLALIELYTLSYRGPDEAFGLGVRALSVPQESGWKAVFAYVEDGRTVIGDGWNLSFTQQHGSSARPGPVVGLGRTHTYRVIQTHLVHASQTPALDEIAGYLAGPEAMRDRGLEALRAMADMVRTQIKGGQVPACDWSEYKGDGIPPACTPRAMTAADKAEELDRLEGYLAEQEALLEGHYREMYAAWMRAFPFDGCWPPAPQ